MVSLQIINLWTLKIGDVQFDNSFLLTMHAAVSGIFNFANSMRIVNKLEGDLVRKQNF